MLLKNQLVNDEVKEEIKNYLETNDKTEPYRIYGLHEKQSWKFIAIQALFEKQEKFQIHNLTYYLKI